MVMLLCLYNQAHSKMSIQSCSSKHVQIIVARLLCPCSHVPALIVMCLRLCPYAHIMPICPYVYALTIILLCSCSNIQIAILMLACLYHHAHLMTVRIIFYTAARKLLSTRILWLQPVESGCRTNNITLPYKTI